MMIENNINLKALDIVVCPLPIFSLYLAINFDTAMKADHMYMTGYESHYPYIDALNDGNS
jgi:hypothetical protein